MTDQPVIIPSPADARERFQPPVSPAAEPFWDATRDVPAGHPVVRRLRTVDPLPS